MVTNDSQRALRELESGNFARAGDYYTQASYQSLSQNSIIDRNTHQIGSGLDNLLRASLAYHRGGYDSRSQNRCHQGVAIARGFSELLDDSKAVAVIQEYIADFHGIGGLDGADDEYQSTLDHLDAAGIEYTHSYHSSPLSDGIISFSKYIFELADVKSEIEFEVIYDFANRVRYKKANMEKLLGEIDDPR